MFNLVDFLKVGIAERRPTKAQIMVVCSRNFQYPKSQNVRLDALTIEDRPEPQLLIVPSLFVEDDSTCFQALPFVVLEPCEPLNVRLENSIFKLIIQWCCADYSLETAVWRASVVPVMSFCEIQTHEGLALPELVTTEFVIGLDGFDVEAANPIFSNLNTTIQACSLSSMAFQTNTSFENFRLNKESQYNVTQAICAAAHSTAATVFLASKQILQHNFISIANAALVCNVRIEIYASQETIDRLLKMVTYPLLPLIQFGARTQVVLNPYSMVEGSPLICLQTDYSNLLSSQSQAYGTKVIICECDAFELNLRLNKASKIAKLGDHAAAAFVKPNNDVIKQCGARVIYSAMNLPAESEEPLDFIVHFYQTAKISHTYCLEILGRAWNYKDSISIDNMEILYFSLKIGFPQYVNANCDVVRFNSEPIKTPATLLELVKAIHADPANYSTGFSNQLVLSEVAENVFELIEEEERPVNGFSAQLQNDGNHNFSNYYFSCESQLMPSIES